MWRLYILYAHGSPCINNATHRGEVEAEEGPLVGAGVGAHAVHRAGARLGLSVCIMECSYVVSWEDMDGGYMGKALPLGRVMVVGVCGVGGWAGIHGEIIAPGWCMTAGHHTHMT